MTAKDHDDGLTLMDYTTITVEKRGATDWLTLNRPEAMNSISLAMVHELSDYFGKLYNDASVRIVVMRGAGRAFCAGLDIKDQGARDPRRHPLWRRLRLPGLSRRCLYPHAALPAADHRCGARRRRAAADLPLRWRPISASPAKARG